MPRPSARGDHKTVPPRRNFLCPASQKAGQPPRVLVIAGHLHSRHGTPSLQVGSFALRNLGNARRCSWLGAGTAGACVIKEFQGVVGLFAAMKPGRAEKYHGVLNLLPPESSQGLTILRNNADKATVGAVQKAGILISQRSASEGGTAFRCGGSR